MKGVDNILFFEPAATGCCNPEFHESKVFFCLCIRPNREPCPMFTCDPAVGVREVKPRGSCIDLKGYALCRCSIKNCGKVCLDKSPGYLRVPGMIADGNIFIAECLCGVSQLTDSMFTVAPYRVNMKIS